MDVLLEEDEINYKNYLCNLEVLFDNVDRLLDCTEMLVHAMEYPNDRGFWYSQCIDSLPVSDELFPSLLKEHFGEIKMTTFCQSDLETQDHDRSFKFQNDCLIHFRQLNSDQIYSLHDKLLYALECLQVDLKM